MFDIATMWWHAFANGGEHNRAEQIGQVYRQLEGKSIAGRRSVTDASSFKKGVHTGEYICIALLFIALLRSVVGPTGYKLNIRGIRNASERS